MKSEVSQKDWMRDSYLMYKAIERAFEPRIEECKRRWTEEIQYNLDSEGASVGGWKALSERTRELRRALGYSGGRMLEMRGDLRRNWHVEGGADVFWAYMSVIWTDKGGGLGSITGSTLYADGTFLKTWDGDDLAALHHKGGIGFNPITRESFSVPARPLYNEAELARIFEELVESQIEMIFQEAALDLLGGG